MDINLYKSKISCDTVSLISGKHQEEVEYTDKMFNVPILKAFIDDDEIQQIQVVSTNIGFVRTFQKKFI